MVWARRPRSRNFPPYALLTPAEDKEFVASGPEQFRTLVERVLNSDEVTSVTASLMAHVKGLAQKNGESQPQDSA